MTRYSRDLKMLVGEDYFKHRPNKTGEYYGVEIKTNSRGWRENEEISVKKESGTKRILVLGDSTTLGWGVSSDKIYPYLVESYLNNETSLGRKYEVINTGVGNYNTYMEYQTLRRTIEYEPDIIILGFCLNDFEIWKSPNKFTNKIILESRLYWFIWDKVLNSAVRFGLYSDFEHYYRGMYSNAEARAEVMGDIEKIFALAKQHNSTLIFVNIPELHKLNPYPFKEVNKDLESFIENKGILYLDLTMPVEDFDAQTLWISYEDPHPNEIAHEIFAKQIVNFMKAKGLVD
jgi:lysophospholipase L1-like esterase